MATKGTGAVTRRTGKNTPGATRYPYFEKQKKINMTERARAIPDTAPPERKERKRSEAIKIMGLLKHPEGFNWGVQSGHKRPRQNTIKRNKPEKERLTGVALAAALATYKSSETQS